MNLFCIVSEWSNISANLDYKENVTLVNIVKKISYNIQSSPLLVSQATPFDPQHRICITSYRYAEKGSGRTAILDLFQWNVHGQLYYVLLI